MLSPHLSLCPKDSYFPAPPPHPSSRSNRDQESSTTLTSPRKPVPPINIAVMGATGSGKTSFINQASGSSLHVVMNLESSVEGVQLSDEFTLDERKVVLIDTPGFDNTSRSDADILISIAAFLATAYEAGSKVVGVIYIHRISNRLPPRNFKMFRELCGDSALRSVILVTNMWGDVTKDVGEAREQELTTNFFKQGIDKGAQLARHQNTTQSAHDIIRRIMKNQPVVLQIQRELVDEHKDIINTAAMRNDSTGVASNHQEERRRMVETMREMREQARRERERSELRRRSLQSTQSILPLASSANEKLQAHDTYYMDDRMVVLSCGRILFRIPRWHLNKYCPNLLLPSKPNNNTNEAQGTSDDTAIPIGDRVSAEEFTIFLNFFYSSIFRKGIPAKEWCRLLTIASKLDCREVRAKAIDELTTRKVEVSSIARIELGNKYDVTEWLPEAYAEVFTRGSHLTIEEGEKLGLEVTVKVLEGRDKCKRGNWTHSGDGNVVRLVKQIFPPPAAPRFAGRAVYSPEDLARRSLPRRSGVW